jgi:cyclopropane-fatty-acyl-phospholipid synthase
VEVFVSIASSGPIGVSFAARDGFFALLDRYVEDATIQVIYDGGEWTVGGGGANRRAPESVTLVVHRNRFFGRVLGYANLGLGEAFMDGDFEVPDGRLPDLLTILVRARLDRKLRGDWRLALRTLGIALYNRVAGPRRNVERHFDVGDDLFESFLDPTLTYTCGYAESEDDDLATLQQQKLDRICAKLRLRRGHRVLDVGCGFGGLLLHAVRNHDVLGTGIVNSCRHYERARERVEQAGLSDQIEIRLADHRSMSGQYDRVVSVGVLEHLPRREHPRYFANVRKVLAPGGLGLAHFIGCGVAVNEHDPFIQKYVFPGSCQLKLSEVSGLLERNELAILDVENIVRHYGITCTRWLERFRSARPTLDANRYDEVFQRMFEYYLSLCIAAARASDGALYQVLYGNDFAAEHPLRRV